MGQLEQLLWVAILWLHRFLFSFLASFTKETNYLYHFVLAELKDRAKWPKSALHILGKRWFKVHSSYTIEKVRAWIKQGNKSGLESQFPTTI